MLSNGSGGPMHPQQHPPINHYAQQQQPQQQPPPPPQAHAQQHQMPAAQPPLSQSGTRGNLVYRYASYTALPKPRPCASPRSFIRFLLLPLSSWPPHSPCPSLHSHRPLPPCKRRHTRSLRLACSLPAFPASHMPPIKKCARLWRRRALNSNTASMSNSNQIAPVCAASATKTAGP